VGVHLPGKSSGDANGGRTPAWVDGSRTVNPYDGSRTSYGGGNRTPAWSSGQKTPAYGLQQDGFAAGSKTPDMEAVVTHGDQRHRHTSILLPPVTVGARTNQRLVDGAEIHMMHRTPGAHMSAAHAYGYERSNSRCLLSSNSCAVQRTDTCSSPTPPRPGELKWAPTPQAMDAPTLEPNKVITQHQTPGAYGMPETPAANWQDDDLVRRLKSSGEHLHGGGYS